MLNLKYIQKKLQWVMGQKNWRQTKLSVFASQPPSGTINPTPYKCPVTKTKVVLSLSSRGSYLAYVQFPLMVGSFTIVTECTFSIWLFWEFSLSSHENFHYLYEFQYCDDCDLPTSIVKRQSYSLCESWCKQRTLQLKGRETTPNQR